MALVARAIQHQSSPITCYCMSNSLVSHLCFSCHQLICQQCVASSHSTAQHVVESIGSLKLEAIDAHSVGRLVDRLRASRASAPSLMTVMCPRHPTLPVFSYCETCSQPVCQDCTPNHFSTKVGDHVTIHLLKNFDAQTYRHECGFFAAYIKHIRESVSDLRDLLDNVNKSQVQLNQQHHGSNMAVLGQFDQYANKAMQLQQLYSEQSDEFLSGIALAGGLEKVITDVEQLKDECRRLNLLFERARENCSAAEMSSLREWVRRKVYDIRQRCRNLNQSVSLTKRRHSTGADLMPARHLVDVELPRVFDQRTVTKTPFGGSVSSEMTNGFMPSQAGRFPTSASSVNLPSTGAAAPMNFPPRWNETYDRNIRSQDYFPQQATQPAAPVWPNNMSAAMTQNQFSRLVNAAIFNPQQLQQQKQSGVLPCQPARPSPVSALFNAIGRDRRLFSVIDGSTQGDDNDENCEQVESGVVTDSPLLMAPISVAIPNRLQLRYIAKIGQFGESDGQFTEPSGIATNLQNQLVVADTNSHRIQVFNNHGAFMWRFGECGKRAGQVLYPNRIAIGPEGEYVFTERAPQCLVQVFDASGNFIRRFGSGDLRHPRGLCIDHEGHVLVLECQVMSVTIYDMRGTRLRRFNFEGIRFPSSICVNDQQEIFIADNIQHYVYVYSYDGAMKRRIGGYPTINFPVGVAINHLGQLVVADNHNNFNITVFTQEGIPISGYESCVKHAQVLDVCLLNAGRAVAISCKDYRVYVYPYQDCPPGSLADISGASAADCA